MANELSVKVDMQRKMMVVEIPMQDPTVSKSGKSQVIASTHGNVQTKGKYQEHDIYLGLNAYIKTAK